MWKYLITASLLTLGTLALSQAESTPQLSQATPSEPSSATQSTGLPATLPPDMFTGTVRQAYQVAADMPGVLAELNCHCGCDRSQGHRNLLDCFSDTHAVG